MTEPEIVERLRAFIVENFLFGDASRAPEAATSFLETGLVDSTGMLELVFFVEESFGLKIADEELIPENLDSCQRIAAFVLRRQGGAAQEVAR